MKILQLSPQVPLPLDSGGRISIYGILKYLSERGNEVYFAAYQKNYDRKLAEAALQEFCHPFIINASIEDKVFPAFLNLFSNVPYNISKFKTKELEKFLVDFLKKYKVDIVHVDHLHLGWTVDIIKNIVDVPVVLREHNLELKIMQRFSEQQRNFFLKVYSGIQYKKFVGYEPAVAEKFDKCIMVSREDEKALLKMNPKVRTATIPIGVGKELLNIRKSNIIPFSMFHLGSMSWLPNLDGLNWYLDEVFPRVIEQLPDVTLYLYGSGTEKLKTASSLEKNIIKVGYVKDIWSEVINKQLAIVPLRIGSGIRVKIIEMLATGQNIISTSIGKEGISVRDGNEILLADTANEFVDKTIRYFNNDYDSEKMSMEAKKTVVENYTWEIISEKIENEYNKLLSHH
ncbi:MAG: glycosyltransferase family 4 protein [Ignavibacteriaceae bacterium]